MKSSKMGMGLKQCESIPNFDLFLVSLVMIFVVSNYIIHSTTCEQAYYGARNSGFSDYACIIFTSPPPLPPPIFHKVSATCTHGGLKSLKTVYSTDK